MAAPEGSRVVDVVAAIDLRSLRVWRRAAPFSLPLQPPTATWHHSYMSVYHKHKPCFTHSKVTEVSGTSFSCALALQVHTKSCF